MDLRSISSRVDIGELGAKEEYLGRVIDPHKDYQNRSRRAVEGTDRTEAQVDAQCHGADTKQQRGHGRPHPDVTPLDLDVGQYLVEKGKEERNDD